MKVNVDPDMCIGCGLCYGAMPEVFHSIEDGRAESIPETGEENRAEVQEIADSCPVGAIAVE